MRTCKHSIFIDDEFLIDVSSTKHVLKITVQLSSQYDSKGINESMTEHWQALNKATEYMREKWKHENETIE